MHNTSSALCIEAFEGRRAALYAPRMTQSILAQNVTALRKHLKLNQAAFGEMLGSDQPNVSKWESKGVTPGTSFVAKLAELAGCSVTAFIGIPWRPVEPQEERPRQFQSDGEVGMVGIQHADLALGMGAAFIDNHVDVEVLQFPRKWVETITYSPAELLTWAHGRGDSMTPTIHDGDLVMIDRSQRDVREQDAIWAFTVGDVGSIKRLRVKGDRFIILSDNPSVPDDEEPQDFVRIVGRVVFVGAKK